MAGVKVYRVDMNSIQVHKRASATVGFSSWILSTISGGTYELFNSVAQSGDGGYVAVGSQQSDNLGSGDAYIVKYDDSLNVVAQRSLRGTGNDSYNSVVQSHDGGYVVVGIQATQTQGVFDALIVKYDGSLGVVAQKSLGLSASDRFQSVVQSHDGGYIAVGYQASQTQGSNDALIVKYDNSLNITSQHGLGSGGNDQYHAVTQSHDGGYIAVGRQSSQGQGDYDALIVKYDASLGVVAQKSIGGSGSDVFQSVVQSHDGGYIAAGYQDSETQGNRDAFVVKYDANLNVVAQVGLGGTTVDFIQSIAQSDDGGYMAVALQETATQFVYSTIIVKYDSNLNVVSKKSLEGTDQSMRFIVKTNDNGYIITGVTEDSGEVNMGTTIKIPDNLTQLSGAITNHPYLSWADPTITINETVLGLTEITNTLVETTPTLTHFTTSLSEATTTFADTRSEKQ